MTKSVKFGDLALAFEFVSSERQYVNSAFVCRSTGQIFYAAEFEDSDELPDDVDDQDLYAAIPHKNDLDLGQQLAFDFAARQIPQEFRQVTRMFSSRGAYSRFRGVLEDKGVLESWYAFEEEETSKRLRAWCEEEGIPLLD